MEDDKKYGKDDAYQTLELINSWINNVDTKSSFGLAFIAALVGFIFYNIGKTPLPIQEALELVQTCTFSMIVFVQAIMIVALYISCLVSILMFLIALFGRAKNTSGKLSIMFFGTISQFSLNDYKAKTLNMNSRDITKDLVEQIYVNSKICTKKFKYYNWGMYALAVSTLLCFVCISFNLI